jgi:hypothetical protein
MFNVKSKTITPGHQGLNSPKNLIGFFVQLHEWYGDSGTGK